MTPGAYVLCRPIDDGPAQHQFLALVSADSSALPGFVKPIAGKQVCVMGAYNVGGYLRASLFAASDVSFLEKKLANPADRTVQSSRVELQACLIGSEDPFLSCITRCFSRYRSFEGSKSEIKYPAGTNLLSTIGAQMKSSNFNSNSWAQSVLFWAQMIFVPGKNLRDFNGLDVGNDRVIPRTYFLPT